MYSKCDGIDSTSMVPASVDVFKRQRCYADVSDEYKIDVCRAVDVREKSILLRNCGCGVPVHDTD